VARKVREAIGRMVAHVHDRQPVAKSASWDGTAAAMMDIIISTCSSPLFPRPQSSPSRDDDDAGESIGGAVDIRKRNGGSRALARMGARLREKTWDEDMGCESVMMDIGQGLSVPLAWWACRP
jgi:hypothetical protein